MLRRTSRLGCGHRAFITSTRSQLLDRTLLVSLPPCRSFHLARRLLHSTRITHAETVSEPISTNTSPSVEEKRVYKAPLENSLYKIKIFSLSSLALSTTLSPVMFIVESSLPFVPRLALAATAIGTSALSTAVITYATKPYAVKFRTLEPAEGGALEFTTYNAFLQPRITRVRASCRCPWRITDRLSLYIGV